MRAAQKARLKYIDFLFMFTGSVSRNDLAERFGISEAAATRDLAEYRNMHGEDAPYLDQKSKSYITPTSFTPIFQHSGTEALRGLATGQYPSVDESHPLIPSELPIELDHVDVNTLGVITRAIKQRYLISIEYRSHSSGFTRRDCVPFAVVDNGLRWHIRAYDRKRQRFTDFVLARISNPSFTGSSVEAHELPENDIQWNRIVELQLVPHPALDHPETTEHEFRMTNGQLILKVRAAVAGYVLRRWNIDCSPDHSLTGNEYHLWLKNSQALYGVETLEIAPGYSTHQ